MEKTHWKKLHNPDYIGAYSLDQGGKFVDLNVIITKVNKHLVKGPDGKEEECIVAELKGQKPLILNATNCKTLKKLFDSPYIEDWCNKKVTLTVEKVKAFGDIHDAIRIKKSLPVKLELTPSNPKWNSAVDAIQKGNVTIEQLKETYTVTPENEALLCKK